MILMDTIEANASRNIRKNEGDFYRDGLLYCGRCLTPKQTRVQLYGEVHTPMCLCKCEQEKREKEAEERRKQEAIERVKRLKKMGFPDAEMQKWSFDLDDHKNEKISQVALRYVEHFPEMRKKGKGLLLYGNVGTGKTFISACIANALIDLGHPCLVTNFARLTNTISASFDKKQEYMDALNKFTLLVIDDLASERDTEYMGEIVQSIIDARYRSGKPLIVTTNLPADELKHPSDIRKQRVYSRLFEMCIPVEVTGADRRKEKLKSDFRELRGMLGL